LLDRAGDEATARLAAGRADNLGEARARADRVAQTGGFHVGPAAALGPHEAAVGEGRERAAHRVPVHAEPLCDLDFARQPRIGRIAAVRDRALELIGHPPPKGDAGDLRRAQGRAVAAFRHAVSHGIRRVSVIKLSRLDATKVVY
jgi:hypothetical protein